MVELTKPAKSALDFASLRNVVALVRLMLPHVGSRYFLQYLRHIRQTDLLPVSRSPESAAAVGSALDRWDKIVRFLGIREGSSALSEEQETPQREFMEIYGGLDFNVDLASLDANAAIGQKARLKRQLDHIALLLLDRVVDHVEVLRRRGINTITCVRLSCAPDKFFPRQDAYSLPSNPLFSETWQLSTDVSRNTLLHALQVYFKEALFPWRVVIEATDPLGLRSVLLESGELLNWFGIGVDVGPSRGEPQMTLSCDSSGKRGVVGGRLVARRRGDNGVEFLGLTCAHVVSDSCKCLVAIGWNGNSRSPISETSPDALVHEPDAALICPKYSQCECELSATTTVWQAAVASNGPEDSAKYRPTTRLTPSERTRRMGYIFNVLGWYPMNKRYHRVPSIDIKPYSFVSWGQVFRHPFERTFSSPGDSGSWVIDIQDQSKWYGMIAANEPKYQSSYAIDSRYLYFYFSERLRRQHLELVSIEALFRGSS